MDICKYCKKWGFCKNMTRLALLMKHIWFFIVALISVIFKERLLLNVLVILLFVLLQIFYPNGDSKNLIQGALLAIIITANLERSANHYKENILWDGDWEIWNWEKRNFEHKKGVYISLCTELSNIIAMISYNLKKYHDGPIFTSEDCRKVITQRLEYTLPIDIKPDFNRLDDQIAFERFERYRNAFRNVENTIFAIQGLLTHINAYCPDFNVKSTVAILVQELYNTKKYVFEVDKFIKASSVYDDALKWNLRLRLFRNNKNINTGTLENNVNNLVASIYEVYRAINKDLDFNKVDGAHD